MAEAIGGLTCVVFVFVSFYVFFKLVEATIGNRVTAEAEIEGLDVPEMGVLGYPDFVLGPNSQMVAVQGPALPTAPAAARSSLQTATD